MNLCLVLFANFFSLPHRLHHLPPFTDPGPPRPPLPPAASILVAPIAGPLD